MLVLSMPFLRYLYLFESVVPLGVVIACTQAWRCEEEGIHLFELKQQRPFQTFAHA